MLMLAALGVSLPGGAADSTLLPSADVDSCRPCTDRPTSYMLSEGSTCKQLTREQLGEKCGWFEDEGSCQQTCFNTGHAYSKQEHPCCAAQAPGAHPQAAPAHAQEPAKTVSVVPTTMGSNKDVAARKPHLIINLVDDLGCTPHQSPKPQPS